eukprot:scaffold2608_cov362-Prasinococcus_capsulatus_cf.AAC.2
MMQTMAHSGLLKLCDPVKGCKAPKPRQAAPPPSADPSEPVAHKTPPQGHDPHESLDPNVPLVVPDVLPSRDTTNDPHAEELQRGEVTHQGHVVSVRRSDGATQVG